MEKTVPMAALDEAYEALKPIANRSTVYDVQKLAMIGMRYIETVRGDEKKTEIPPTHHP